LALYALGVAIVSLVCYITYAVFILVGVL